jgi:hypothetical protein
MVRSFLQAAAELKMMQERRVTTEQDAKLFLLRAKMVLLDLSPADQFELETMYRNFVKGRK